MIILGLGSNIGDRLAHLRKAQQLLAKHPQISVIQTSPVYQSDALLPENAGDDWDQPYLNAAIRCESNLEPHDLLKALKAIEKQIGRPPAKRHWGPRVIDIDILAWDDCIIHDDQLDIPHKQLSKRPFALWPLADVAPFWVNPENPDKTAEELVLPWGSRFSGEAPFHTKQIQHRIDTPEIMGVVNVTPDSFSDGGRWDSVDKAIQHAIDLANAGATVLDIGAESTAPSSKPITEKEEWQRLEPILSALEKTSLPFNPKISIDTRHSLVAEKAIQHQVDWINDVTGFQDAAMRRLAADAKVDCVMMHHVSIPANKDKIIPRNVCNVQYTLDWAKKRIDEMTQDGIALEKIIFDPGIGFGRAAEHSFAMLKQSADFAQLGTRVLIGHSRKSFLNRFTAHTFSERDIETLAISLHLAKQPVDYIRVHNVDMTLRGLKIASALS